MSFPFVLIRLITSTHLVLTLDLESLPRLVNIRRAILYYTMPKRAPYGTWSSPISASAIARVVRSESLCSILTQDITSETDMIPSLAA